MPSRTIHVSTAAQLRDALATVTGGETIMLADGNYGDLWVTPRSKFDITHDVPVTITSADPGNPAVLTGLDMRDAAGFTFEHIKFDYVWKDGQSTRIEPFRVSNSRDITISGSTFDGDTAESGKDGAIGYATGRGLASNDNTNFTFIDNTMHSFWKGLGIGGSTGVRVIGNEFHSMRSDGLNANGVQDVLIEDNHFHDFIRAPELGDHADFIQFASTDAKRPSADVTIRGNLFDIGQGGNTQTIFMRNDQVDKGLAGPEMFYRNVLIEQNTLYNDHQHGISVGETAGLVIRNNALLQADGGSEGPTGPASLPRIGVAGASTDVTIVNNLVAKAGYEEFVPVNPDWIVSNNLSVQFTDRDEPDHLSRLFVSTSLDADGPEGRAFLAMPGGLIETMGVGSDRILIDRTPEAVRPVFHVGVQPADPSVLVFGADSFSFGPQGALADAGARFLWSFGDGATAEGGLISHRYASPGTYAVTLEAVLPDGSRVAVTDRVEKHNLDLLRLDGNAGDFVASDGFTDRVIDAADGALVAASGRQALDLDAATKAAIGPGQIADLFHNDNFVLDMRLKADLTPDSWGNVIRLQNVLSGGVNRDGDFSFTLKTDAGEATVVSQGVSLLDGNEHDVRILFHGAPEVLSISVDGMDAVTASLAGNLPPQGSWPLMFGNPPTGPSFDGKLLSFDLDVDRSDYPAYAEPEPLPVLDDYVLDSAAIAALRATALRGDALRVEDDGRTVLSFDGSGDQALLGRMSQFAGSERLAVSVEFKRDVADGSTGRLVANKNQIVMAVEDDGFQLNVATADAGMKLYQIADLGLNDTDWHRATVIVDAQADRLQLIVDDRMVLDNRSQDFLMTNPNGTSRGWRAAADFDGMIAEIRIDNDIAPLLHHPVDSDIMAFF